MTLLIPALLNCLGEILCINPIEGAMDVLNIIKSNDGKFYLTKEAGLGENNHVKSVSNTLFKSIRLSNRFKLYYRSFAGAYYLYPIGCN